MDRIFRVRRIDARLVPYDWAWAAENRDEIAAHWARRQAERPAIFNGRVLMIAESRVEADELKASFFEVDYASFLTWLDREAPDRSVENGFAMGALMSSDGAYLLGVMGAHTSQAGRIYFPAGTPDPTDVTPDGIVDLASSITREIEEETGISRDEYAVEPGWIVTRIRHYTALMRQVTLPWPAEEARARILAHLARDPEPELADIRIVRGPAEIDAVAMPAYLTAFLRWRFVGEREGAWKGESIFE